MNNTFYRPNSNQKGYRYNSNQRFYDEQNNQKPDVYEPIRQKSNGEQYKQKYVDFNKQKKPVENKYVPPHLRKQQEKSMVNSFELLKKVQENGKLKQNNNKKEKVLDFPSLSKTATQVEVSGVWAKPCDSIYQAPEPKKVQVIEEKKVVELPLPNVIPIISIEENRITRSIFMDGEEEDYVHENNYYDDDYIEDEY